MRRLAQDLTLALTLLATPALADSPRDEMFPSDGSCYLRHYDRAHLAAHPGQNIAEIAIGPLSGAFDARELILNVRITLRGSGNMYSGAAYCENTGGSLSCHLEGDAGWFTLTPRPGGAVRLDVGKGGIVFEGRDFLYISGTMGDDRQFLMPPVPADSCT